MWFKAIGLAITLFVTSTIQGQAFENTASIINADILAEYVSRNALYEAFPYGQPVYVHLQHDVDVSLNIKTAIVVVTNRVNSKSGNESPPYLAFNITPNAIERESEGELQSLKDYRLESDDKKCLYTHAYFEGSDSEIHSALILIDSNQPNRDIIACLYSGSLTAFGIKSPFISRVRIQNEEKKSLLTFLDFIAIEVAGACRNQFNETDFKIKEQLKGCAVKEFSNQFKILEMR